MSCNAVGLSSTFEGRAGDQDLHKYALRDVLGRILRKLQHTRAAFMLPSLQGRESFAEDIYRLIRVIPSFNPMELHSIIQVANADPPQPNQIWIKTAEAIHKHLSADSKNRQLPFKPELQHRLTFTHPDLYKKRHLGKDIDINHFRHVIDRLHDGVIPRSWVQILDQASKVHREHLAYYGNRIWKNYPRHDAERWPRMMFHWFNELAYLIEESEDLGVLERIKKPGRVEYFINIRDYKDQASLQIADLAAMPRPKPGQLVPETADPRGLLFAFGDFLGYDLEDETAYFQHRQLIKAPAVFKPSENADFTRETFNDILNYTHELWAAQPTRGLVLAFSLSGSLMRLFALAPWGPVYVSKSFNIHAEPHHFLWAMINVMFLENKTAHDVVDIWRR